MFESLKNNNGQYFPDILLARGYHLDNQFNHFDGISGKYHLLLSHEGYPAGTVNVSYDTKGITYVDQQTQISFNGFVRTTLEFIRLPVNGIKQLNIGIKQTPLTEPDVFINYSLFRCKYGVIILGSISSADNGTSTEEVMLPVFCPSQKPLKITTVVGGPSAVYFSAEGPIVPVHVLDTVYGKPGLGVKIPDGPLLDFVKPLGEKFYTFEKALNF